MRKFYNKYQGETLYYNPKGKDGYEEYVVENTFWQKYRGIIGFMSILLILVIGGSALSGIMKGNVDGRVKVLNATLEETNEYLNSLLDKETDTIIYKLEKDDFEHAESLVAGLSPSPQQIEINHKFGIIKDQYESQREGQRLVLNLLKEGQPDIDIHPDNLGNKKTLEDFPKNYHPKYVDELYTKYSTTYDHIAKVHDYEREFTEIANNTLDVDMIRNSKAYIDSLPISATRSRLQDKYTKGLQEVEERIIKHQEEQARQAEKERQRQERLRELEAERERIAEIERQKELEEAKRQREQELIEQQRQAEQEQKRLKEQERIRREHEEHLKQQQQEQTPEPETPEESENTEE